MSRNKQTTGAKTAAKKAAAKKSPLPLFIIFGVLGVAVVAGALLINSNNSGSTLPRNIPQQSANRANYPPGAEPPRSKGSPNAPVVIEEFGDYQCPSCGYLHPVVNKLYAEYGDRVYFIFRHLPLAMHDNAALAARAAEAAGLQSKFWEMHNLIYENQKEWSEQPNPRPTFDSYAQRIGIDINKFRADIDGQMVAVRIRADVQRANSFGITGTPAVFINGVGMPSLKEEDLRREIEAALRSKAQ